MLNFEKTPTSKTLLVDNISRDFVVMLAHVQDDNMEMIS